MVTDWMTFVTKGKTLVTKQKTLVTKGKTMVIKGKTKVTKHEKNDRMSQVGRSPKLPAGPRLKPSDSEVSA